MIHCLVTHRWHACTRIGPHFSYCAYLARNLDAEVLVVPYPLAPTNKAAEIIPVLTTVYEAFLKRAGDREAIVAGDR